MIVGKGNFEHYLELAFKSSGRITFTGFLQEEELNKIYSISDLCICMSKSEQNSYVILEMMSKGLPIIISDIEAHNNEKYIDSVNVLKVPLRNQEIKSSILLDVINKAYNNPELLKKLSINSYKTYISHFTQNQMVSSTLQVYSRLIEQ
ncbi:MAG: glycosyltransferase family 4 protein [Sphingobacterium sp.]|nr:glycosyltransferase family 4 protein [Sphingobacterium sp.]